MARAKNTSRAEARRRTREQMRADMAAEEPTAEDQETTTSAAAAERPRLFKMPDVRADIRALPQVIRSRRLIWLPLLILIVGLGATLALPGLVSELAAIAELYIQFFFVPPALFTFFVAGFIAPRASYLFGFLYGLLAGVMWSIVILTQNTLIPGDPTLQPQALDPVGVLLNMMLIGALYGTLAAAFAAWYRDFLRGMQERGRARRAEREAQERAKRREERQESRRVAKRPSS